MCSRFTRCFWSSISSCCSAVSLMVCGFKNALTIITFCMLWISSTILIKHFQCKFCKQYAQSRSVSCRLLITAITFIFGQIAMINQRTCSIYNFTMFTPIHWYFCLILRCNSLWFYWCLKNKSWICPPLFCNSFKTLSAWWFTRSNLIGCFNFLLFF